jgi:hypothetical protein
LFLISQILPTILIGFITSYYFVNNKIWLEIPTTSTDSSVFEATESMKLNQAVFEQQQNLLNEQLNNSINANKPAKNNTTTNNTTNSRIYAITYAPYADEKTFKQESALVASTLEKRFNIKVLQLVNHASTVKTLPWATQQNLKKSIAVFSKQMQKDKDILIVYLTSHGAEDGTLSARHWPLDTESLLPSELSVMLKDADIKYTAIIVSSCYAGTWIKPLENDNRLIMTAADANHTSYGCGNFSDITFFGKAMFGEAFNQTSSFEQAFNIAKPVIKQREEKAGKDDGFSNPQLIIGKSIKPILNKLTIQYPIKP